MHSANEDIDAEKPWVLAKEEDGEDKLHKVATTGINLFYQLVVALQPVLPKLAEDAFAFLNVENIVWNNVATPLTDHSVNKFKPLAQRVEDSDIEKVVDASKATLEGDNTITIDDFAKLDLRVAEVLECNHDEGADKLLQFQLDVGELGKRQVFSGIKAFYPNPEELGKKVVLVANLAPRKMRFGMSEGMILSSENKDGLFLMAC